MFHVESTARCPRTPVLLLALAEAGIDFEVEVRPDGYFEQTYGEPGPRFDSGDGPRIGLTPLLETVRSLPGLGAAAERADAWFPKLEAVRAVMPKLAAAKREGQPPPADALAVVMGFVGELERSLQTNPWVAGDAFSSADVAMSFVGFLSRLGLAIGPNARAWLGRVRARPSWQRVVERYPSAADVAG